MMKHLSVSATIMAVVYLTVCGGSVPARAETVGLVSASATEGLELFAATELQRYLERLFGVSVRIASSPDESADALFFLGVSKRNPTEPPGPDGPATLSDQGYRLCNTPWKGKPAMSIVGGSPTALMWGVYELVERYGVRYLLNGDVFPSVKRPFAIPDIDRVFEPVFRVRMWKTMGDFAMGMEGWGMADYRPFIDQLAKLKFNRIRISSGPSQPFMAMDVHGAKNTSATLWYGAHFPITDDMPGRKLFGNEKEFWNPDLPQPDAGYEKLLAAGEQHCNALIAYANSRGIASSFVGAITDFPKEFASILPETRTVQQLGELTVSPGPTVRPDNPVLIDVAGTILKTVIDTFPDAGSYGFPVGTEWPSWIDLYQWAWQELDARYHIGEVTTLEAVLDAASKRTQFTGGADRAVMQVKGDLAGLCFADRLRTSPEFLPKSRKPDAALVYYEIAEELFPILPRVLPKGAELLVVLDYTPTRVLRRPEAFDKIPAKEIPTILAVTLQDDGVGVPPQLTTGSLHKLVGMMREHGLAGFCTRQWMISDLDPSTAYLAKAAWDADATPESAYCGLIRDVCGEAAVEPMLDAFREIEAVTVGLEDHGLGIGFPVPSMIVRHWSPDAFPAEYAADREGYRRAMAAIRKIPALESPVGQAYIQYWIGRLEFGIGFFDTIEIVKRAAAAEKAANDAKQKGDTAGFQAKIAEAIEQGGAAEARAAQALESFASVSRNQSDRGAIATLGEYLYRPLKKKSEELRALSGSN